MITEILTAEDCKQVSEPLASCGPTLLRGVSSNPFKSQNTVLTEVVNLLPLTGWLLPKPSACPLNAESFVGRGCSCVGQEI